jgi:hypothetical protein
MFVGDDILPLKPRVPASPYEPEGSQQNSSKYENEERLSILSELVSSSALWWGYKCADSEYPFVANDVEGCYNSSQRAPGNKAQTRTTMRPG